MWACGFDRTIITTTAKMSLLCSTSPSQCTISKTSNKTKEWLNFISKTFKLIYEYLIFKMLFQIILNMILYSIVLVRKVNVYFNEKIRKKNLNDKSNIANNMPIHVCFIIHEDLSEENFKRLSNNLANTFVSLGVKILTFYTRDGKINLSLLFASKYFSIFLRC